MPLDLCFVGYPTSDRLIMVVGLSTLQRFIVGKNSPFNFYDVCDDGQARTSHARAICRRRRVPHYGSVEPSSTFTRSKQNAIVS